MIPKTNPLQAHFSLDSRPPFRLMSHWTTLGMDDTAMATYSPSGLFGLRHATASTGAEKPASPLPGLLGGLRHATANLAKRDRQKLVAWNRANSIAGSDVRAWRRDDYGNDIRYADYGDRDSEFGWEIDHVKPLARGGLDIDSNLRALHWRVNASRGV